MFRSVQQLDGVAEALEKREDFVAVMPTGFGKSDLFLLPAFIEADAHTTIIIVPLVSLQKDILKRCEEFGIAAGTWESRSTAGLQVLIVSVEHVGSAEYESVVGEWSNTGKLARIVVDECHLTTTWSSFREPMKRLEFALCPSNEPVQRILLSATIPPEMLKRVAKAHGMPEFQELRMSTVRRNISYRVVVASENKFCAVDSSVMKESLVVLLKEVKFLRAKYAVKNELEGRLGLQIIVFCPTRKMVEIVVGILASSEFAGEVLGYHAGMDPKDRQRIQEKWMQQKSNGSIEVMVATSAFGTGIDSPNVRCVIHVGFCRSTLEYVQESGRAGRDGAPARCNVIFSKRFVARHLERMEVSMPDSVAEIGHRGLRIVDEDGKKEANDKLLLTRFVNYAENRRKCRRQILFFEMDGVEPPPCIFACDAIETFCDICLPFVSTSKEDEIKSTLRQAGSEKNSSANVVLQQGKTHRNEVQGSSIPMMAGSSVAKPVRNETAFNKIPQTSTERNFSKNQACRDEDRALITGTRSLCADLRGFCLLCVVAKGKKHKENKSCSLWKCLACFGLGHDYDVCPIFSPEGSVGERIIEGGVCFACGIGKFNGIDIHERFQYGSRKRCPWYIGLKLSFVILRTGEKRESLVAFMEMNISESDKQLFTIPVDDESYIPTMYKWLVSPDAKGGQLNLVRVLEFYQTMAA